MVYRLVLTVSDVSNDLKFRGPMTLMLFLQSDTSAIHSAVKIWVKNYRRSRVLFQ